MMFISYFKVPIRNSSVTLNVMHSILLTGGNKGKSTYAKKTFNEQGHQLKSYDIKFEFHFFVVVIKEIVLIYFLIKNQMKGYMTCNSKKISCTDKNKSRQFNTLNGFTY